jgi:hypothetical protein
MLMVVVVFWMLCNHPYIRAAQNFLHSLIACVALLLNSTALLNNWTNLRFSSRHSGSQMSLCYQVGKTASLGDLSYNSSFNSYVRS